MNTCRNINVHVVNTGDRCWDLFLSYIAITALLFVKILEDPAIYFCTKVGDKIRRDVDTRFLDLHIETWRHQKYLDSELKN